METKFQTSFIPKKSLMPTGSIGGGNGVQVPHRRRSSLYMTLATLVFIASLGGAGGTYFWKAHLISAQEDYKTQLALEEKRFNTNQIEELKRQDVKISLAEQLLRDHIAASQIFGIIGLMTIEKVRFSSMDLTAGTNPGDDYKVSLKGIGTGFKAVAWQSDVLGKLERYGLRNIVKNPILTDPSLDATGAVSFGFSASIDPKNLSYETVINGPTENAAAATSSPGQ